MAKHKRFSLVVIFLLILVGFQYPQNGLASGGAAFLESAGSEVLRDAPDVPVPYEQIAENQDFILYADRTTLAFKVIDKRSGYTWSSNLDEVGENDRLNRTWTAFARSGISIDYLDQKAIGKRASITNTNQSIDFKLIDQGFEAGIKFIDPSITMALIVKLEPAGVSVELPFDRIKEEDPAFKLGYVYVYPFMGATREDQIKGYMFIPDGSGSLIRFSSTTKAKNMFYGRYYGADLGMLTTLPFDPSITRPFKISIPVIGMVHGEKENAYIAIVEEGASYGEVQAHPAGIITNFNFIYNAFVYNESYFQATNRSGAGVTTLQQRTNAFNVKIHYRFLADEEADYVGMANSYQQYLVEKGVLRKVANTTPDIGIRLEFLGGEKEKVLFWNRTIPMTTFDQASAILRDLDVLNPQVVYYGWQPLGASVMTPGTVKVDRQLGGMSELRALIAQVQENGGQFYLYDDPQAALKDESGYSPRYDLAMSITNFNLLGYNRNKINFYRNLAALEKHFQSLRQDALESVNAGLAIDGLGSILYSDFKKGNFLNREEAIKSYQEMLEAGEGIMAFYMPNDYVLGYTSAYFDIPLTDSGYIYMSETIPFIQIVLAGYIPYYGTPLNFSSNLKDDLLKHVEYGAYPSFFVTHESTAKILNTNSSWIYTSSISQWKDEIEQAYAFLDALLGPVTGQTIVGREIISRGVYSVTYSNNKQIIVNYNQEPVLVGGTWVDGKDAVIREVAP